VTDSLAYSKDRRAEVSLLKILNDFGAPLYAFSSVIGWAENAYQTGYRFNPRTKHFNTMMKELQEWTQLGDLRPTQKMVTLAKDGFQVPVVCFDFPAVICSLFNDREVNQLKNLVINPDDPFGKYVFPDGKLNDVNSAQIYEVAYDHCCTSEKDFLALVILYMDKTVISQTKEGLSALPVMMTVATFNCEVNILIGVPYLLHSHLLSNIFIPLTLLSSIQTRNKSLAWRPLGFLPNVDNFYSKAQYATLFTTEDKILRFQQMW
jgi:hypothetical protein